MSRSPGLRALATLLLGTVAVGLACCGKGAGSAAAPAPSSASGPALVTSAQPAPAVQIASRDATVIARALAAHGLAEAQVVEATRSAGVLTLRVRFQRAQGAGSVETIYGSPGKDDIYVIGGANKLFPLTDAEGKPLVTPDLFLRLNADMPVAGTWFGKFPAPPPEVKTVSLVLPNVEPLDSIPLSDR